MKQTLLTLFLSLMGCTAAIAQEYNLTVFEDAIFYGMYEATVNEPVPAGAIRHTNSSYAKMLTEEQLASFGNTLTMTVRLNPRCDNYDRIGNVNLAFVPKGSDTYAYNDVMRIEIGRFITPFMDMNDLTPNEVPYVFEVDNLTRIFHDEYLTAQYDFWIEFEVYGYQGGPGQGGAAVEIPGCAGRNDVYQGTLEFTSDNTGTTSSLYNYLTPISYKYELKNYTLDGTDELGETTKTIGFTLPQEVQNAKLYFINSNHGSYGDGEEYNRREHFLYVDGENVLTYTPGGVSCVPYRVYNTQPNCIYYVCDPNGAYLRPDNDAAWSWNNWCPGNKIPIRVVELGTVQAGFHTFTINVPDAVFDGGQGYFPMSVYMQGDAETLSASNFGQAGFMMLPNPATDIVTIVSDETVKTVAVYNTIGQKVFAGTDKVINISGLQQGVYLVEVSFEGGKTTTQKIIKK